MGFEGQPAGGELKVTGLAGRVQEVAAHNTARHEYRGRQSKHDTSSSRALSPQRRAFLGKHGTVTAASGTAFYERASNNKQFFFL